MFTVTPLAAEKLAGLLKANGKKAVRLRIARFGATGGYVYDLDFWEKPVAGDEVIGAGGLKLFLEGKNAHRFEHIMLDYDQQAQGFVFVKQGQID